MGLACKIISQNRLIEWQSAASADTLRANAVSGGFAANDLQIIDMTLDAFRAAKAAEVKTGAELRAALAAKRYERETAGIVWTGIAGQSLPIATDRESQYLIHGAYTAAKDFNVGRDWKKSDGTFYAMTAAQVMAMAQAVLAYVNECRALEKTKSAEIDSTGTTNVNDGWPGQVRA